MAAAWRSRWKAAGWGSRSKARRTSRLVPFRAWLCRRPGGSGRRVVGAIADRGAWDGGSPAPFFLGPLGVPAVPSGLALPGESVRSPRPDRSGTFGVLLGLEPPLLSAVGSQGPEP